MNSNYMPGCNFGAPWEDGAEPIIEDVTDSLGDPYLCEGENCERNAVAELSWPMEDHDLPCGFFCQSCLDQALEDSEK